MRYTDEEIKEFWECSRGYEGFVRFCENHFKTRTIENGLVPLVLNEIQKEQAKALFDDRHVMALSIRQVGLTTLHCAYSLWYSIYHFGANSVITLPKLRNGHQVIHKIREAYENLPKYMQVGVLTNNKGMFELATESKIIICPQTVSSLKGRTITNLFVHDFAYFKDENIMDFTNVIFPVMFSDKQSKVVINTTPNGYNAFYHLYMSVEKGSSHMPFKTYKYTWHDYKDGVRDKREWADSMEGMIGEKSFRQEYESTFVG